MNESGDRRERQSDSERPGEPDSDTVHHPLTSSLYDASTVRYGSAVPSTRKLADTPEHTC